MKTFEAVLKQHKGLGPGFDFLRIALAVSIVAFHAFILSDNPWIRQTPAWFAEYAQVPMFFALSGFLVAGSAMRLSLRNFLINRSLRIIPALGVDVMICALIIGPLTTAVSLSGYFSDRQFFQYFLNVSGWIHYDLPGVFKDHPTTFVNGALWTVPYEMFCYMIMSALIITRWVTKPARVAALAIGLYCIGMLVEKLSGHLPASLLPALEFAFVSRGSQLLLAFVVGILFYQIKAWLPYSWAIFAACCAICLYAAIELPSGMQDAVANRLIGIPVLVYMTVFIGLTPVPVPKLIRSGDYSYGVYLYHDPLLQVIIGLFPAVALIPSYGAVFVLATGLVAVAALATFSWIFIEKPILGLRKKFSFVARIRGVESEAGAASAPPVGDITAAAE